MNQLSTEKRARIIAALAKGTVLKFLRDMGLACMRYHDEHVRALQCERVQADEIWSFCYAKDKNVPEALKGRPGIGSVWTWVAIDSDTKFVVTWYVGDRGKGAAMVFIRDLAGRLANRIQLTTDAHAPYEHAVNVCFGWKVDYAMLMKIYGEGEFGRYVGSTRIPLIGRPLYEDISTSHVERQNLTMRMSMRRFIRKTNGFSKRFGNHRAAVAIHFMYYNFCRIHQTIRVTPAMEMGLADHIWELDELVALIPPMMKKRRLE